jgi:hypothetical protein
MSEEMESPLAANVTGTVTGLPGVHGTSLAMVRSTST